ncbi:MAG: ubiquinol-cytochrome c reductase iron-sulfur subunit [bacterium]
MSSGETNLGRRRFLVASTSVVGAVGAGFVAVPFIKSWMPSARAEAAGAPVQLDISKLAAGQKVTVQWRGKPVFVYRRTKETLELLPKQDERLVDANLSNTEQQPSYISGYTRSIKADVMVLVAICTHLGCVPEYKPEIGPQPFDEEWAGGFYCPCHKSRFDMSGRVYKGVPAPSNLLVPPYHYIGDSQIEIGVNPEGASA